MFETGRSNPKDKVILTVAVTGIEPTKQHSQGVPITPEEIAASVIECSEAGASIAHIHVRDDNGVATMDFAKFEKVVSLVREAKCPIVLNLTTSGQPGASDEDRMLPFQKLLPEMASFDAGTMNWGTKNIFYNSPDFLRKSGLSMQKHNVKPEIEIFDMGMLQNAISYIKEGVIEEPAHFQLCMGAPGGMPATTENLLYLVNHLPEKCTWGAFGIGKGAIEIMMATIALGGGVRVGFEDNVYYSYRQPAKSNAEFVLRAKRIAKEANREIATPDEAREILCLKNCPKYQ